VPSYSLLGTMLDGPPRLDGADQCSRLVTVPRRTLPFLAGLDCRWLTAPTDAAVWCVGELTGARQCSARNNRNGVLQLTSHFGDGGLEWNSVVGH
jgi:hypothetical protein